ncbi:MAG TPA: hypothetical protein PLU75_07480 [Oscillospiraceae bacterium]|nr:hypothetical protein [Oscillospiraceae bacterium]HRW57383.1 hypothetical protein [Oscillospiraceae bacterium]
MSINSHVQLPNGIIKYFKDESRSDKKVWYLDIVTGEINPNTARKLGTVYGYYSDETEDFLNRTIEGPISRVNKKIRSFCAGEIDSISITPKMEPALKKYIKGAMMRSCRAICLFYKYDILAPFFSPQSNHDALVQCSINPSEKEDSIDAFLRGFHLNVLVNKTERNLVVPRNCFYFIRDGNKECIIAPISPQGALMLQPDDFSKECIKEGYMSYQVVKESDQIETMNISALEVEYAYNRDFIASNEKRELEILQEYLKNNRPELEKLRDEFNAII